MAKRTGGKKAAAAAAADSAGLMDIQAALKFLEPAYKDGGTIAIRHGMATMFDGLIAIGTLLPGLAFNANADYEIFKGIIAKCRAVPLIEYDEVSCRIKIVAGRLTAYVPCIPLADTEMAVPTNNMTSAFNGDALVKTLDIVGKVAKETAARLLECTVYVSNASAFACDGKIIWEHWHGQNLPQMAVPKIAVKVLTGIKKKMTGFGCTFDGSNNVNSATFWYEDNSFVRTQLYVEKRPEFDKLLEAPTNLFPIPEGLWEALDGLAPTLGEAGTVILAGKEVKTSEDDGVGGRYAVAGALPARLCLKHDYLSMVAPYVTGVDWIASPETVRFGGENFRAIMSIYEDKPGGVAEREAEKAQQQAPPPPAQPQYTSPPSFTGPGPQPYTQTNYDEEWGED